MSQPLFHRTIFVDFVV